MVAESSDLPKSNDKDIDTCSQGSFKKRNERFCGGRMKKWEYILLYLFITINVVGFVFGILLYTYLIPKYAQYKVDQIGVDGNTIRIHKLDVGRIQNNQIPIAIDARIDAFTVFPIQGGIGDTVIDISSGGKTIASFNLPAIDFWLNEEIVFAANCSVAFTDDQLKNANDLFAMLSSPDGINDLDIYLSLNPQIYGQGIMFYSHLPLHRNLDFGHVTNALGSYFSGNNNLNQFHPLIFFGPDQDSSSQLMHSHFDANEIMVLPESLGNLEVVWTTFQILMDDISALLNTQFAFANPKYVSLSTIDEMEFYFSLEGTKAAKVTLQKLGLSNGLNSNFTIGANLTFTDSEIDPTAVQSAIENASQSYAQKRNFEFGLVGPISISGAPFVAEMTKDLKLQVTLGDLVLLAPQALGSLFNIDFSSIFNQLSQDIIGNSTITADITTDGVAASLGLNLKAFDFLKPPKNVDFPYSTTISVHGPSSKIFQTNLSPISFGIDERGVMLKTNASIIPVNTDQAATDLAKMVNPIISRNPTNSTVGIKDLLFALPGQTPFKWSQSLFGQRILNIGIPPVNMESLLLSISSPAMGTALNRIVQVANGTLDIAQLNDRPGFGASGNLKISYSKNLPAISVNVGYFNLFGTVESSNLVQLTLPNGIDFKPSTSGTTINAAAVIQRGDVLESKIQNLADALLMDGSLPSYFGLTGLVFGDSLKSNIVTFSKVILDFNTTTLQTAVRNENFVTPSLPNNFIAIKGVNLQVASSSKIAVGIEAAFENSFALNLNVGAIALNAQLQNQTILGLKTSPTLISPGTVSQIINLDLALANSNDQLQQSVGAFLQALWNKDTSITSISGVTGFTLTPTNPASSFAAIDQFANITFSTESSKVISFVNDHYQSSANSPIDLSALVPSPDLSKFGLVVDSLDFNVLPRSALSATIGLSYNNYMPITASIPYLQLSLMIDSTPVTNVQLGGLNVGKDLAKMKLSPTFNFQSGSADKISGVISGLMAKKLSNSLAVGHLAFGSSNTDITTLISFANFDITSIVQKGFAVTFSNPIIDMSHLTPDINKLSLSASSLDLNILPNSQVAAAIGLTFNNYLPVTFSIPYIQLSALIDDEHITDLQLKQGLSVSSTTTSLSLSPTAKFSQNIADPVANLVNGWKAGKITNNLKLGGIIIGASPTDQNDFLSKVTIDLSDYLQKSTTWNINTILDLTKLTPSSDISKFSMKAKSISVGVEPSSAISSKLNIDYSNYLPVSVNLPYLKFTAGLDSSPMVDLETNNFGITRNSGNLDTTASFGFKPNSADKISSLWNQISAGHVTSTFSVSGITFGSSTGDMNDMLSKVQFNLPTNFASNSTYAIEQLKSILGITTTGSPIALGSIKADIQPENTIGAKIALDLGVKVPLNINIPYVSAIVHLDNEKIINNFETAINDANGSQIEIDTSIAISDSGELGQKINDIINAIIGNNDIPGTVTGSSLVFGYSASSTTDAFSKISLNYALNSIIPKNISMTPSDFIKKLNLGINNVKLQSKPRGTIEAGSDISFNFDYPVTITGLDYFSLEFNLDQTELVTITSNSPLNLSRGNITVQLVTEISFVSSEKGQDAVAKLISDVENENNLEQIGTITGIAFGHDEKSPFKFLNNLKVDFNVSTILTKGLIQQLKDKVDVDSLISNLVAQKLHLKAQDNGALQTAIGLNVNNFTLGTSGAFTYLSTQINLDDQSLLNVVGDLSFETSNNVLSAALDSATTFSNGNKLKGIISDIAQQTVNGNNVTNTLTVTDIVIGSESTDTIDLFNKVQLKIPLGPIVFKLKKLVEDLISQKENIMSNVGINPQNIDLDVLDENTLVANANAKIEKLNLDLDIDLPYIYAQVAYNKQRFVDNTIENLSFKNNVFDARDLVYMHDNRTTIQSFVTLLGNVVFARNVSTSDIATFNSVSFGFNKASAIDVFSGISIDFKLEQFRKWATVQFDSVSIANIDASIEQEGIVAVATMPTLSFNFPFKMLAEFHSDAKWAINGTADPAKYITVLSVDAKSFNFPHVPVLVQLNLDSNFPLFMQDVITSLVQWESYASNSRVGYLTLTGSNGKAFRLFDSVSFNGPDDLTFADILEIDVFEDNNYDWSGYPNPGPSSPFMMALSAKNLSPFHLNVGNLKVSSGNTPPGAPEPDETQGIFNMVSQGELILINKNEGGSMVSMAGPPTQTILHGNMWALAALGPLTPDLWKAFAALQATPGVEIRTFIRSYRDDHNIEWFQKLTTYLDDAKWLTWLTPYFDIMGEHFVYSNYRDPNGTVPVDTSKPIVANSVTNLSLTAAVKNLANHVALTKI